MAFAAIVCSVAAAPNPAQVEFFEKRIRPMLVNECYDCHDGRKQKGGLRVDFRDGLLKGGDSGPAIQPGNAKGSLLVRVITHEHPEAKMPKERPKLAPAVIQDFITWIADGAADPRDEPSPVTNAGSASGWESTFAARKEWWSFRPVQQAPVPPVHDASWSAHPVDRFLLARLEQKNLAPAAPADRGVLLRRVTFALIGLPPTREELESFLSDTSPKAYTKVVERLLSSPRFGERWARHWMDLVRFAETHGSEGDPEIPNAWRFRDYLIRAFNDDVPIDQLIREQIAGDLLPSPRRNAVEGLNESILGLAQLRMVEHGFQPVDTLDEQVKTIDNQLDVLSKAFQGLTTSCARCHDHKFDPISQRDYYALYGVLASSRPTQVTVDLPEKLRLHRDRLENLKASIKTVLAESWKKAAGELSRHLAFSSTGTNSSVLPIPGDEHQQRIALLERQIAAIDAAGRAAVLKSRGVIQTGAFQIRPVAAWTFDGDARDVLGSWHAELQGGATIRGGRLVLNGSGAFARTPPLDRPLRAKTLEAWVALSTLEQGGGGVISVESLNGGVFDSIVFAERDPRKWMAGSDGFQRTQPVNGPEETIKPGERVHLAIVYDAEHRIALYRNGDPYGTPYRPTGPNTTLRKFEAGETRVLFGMRHTGGGTAFLHGEIEEARLYDSALTPAEVAASFQAGPGLVSPQEIAAALDQRQTRERAESVAALDQERLELKERFPDYVEHEAARNRRLRAIEMAAQSPRHPLSLWERLRNQPAEACAEIWRALQKEQTNARSQASEERTFKVAWDLAGPDAKAWFLHGVNPPERIQQPGDFVVEPDGDRVLAGLLPAGVFSHRLSQKHNGLLTSSRFTVDSDSISVRVLGGKGARVRLIPDNYPLGQGGIFPQATLNNDGPAWVRLDTAYRKGASAYLEFATAEDVGSRDRGASGPGGRSFFGVERIVFHDTRQAPPEESTWLGLLLPDEAPRSAAEVARRIGTTLETAISAWVDRRMTEAQRAFLDTFARSGLLPTTVNELTPARDGVAEYRRLEAEIPVPRRSPGVLETEAHDAPLLARGEPHKPQQPVPRGYLQVVSGKPFPPRSSGRLQLAEELTNRDNPLTARVMANRVWHQLFGRGLVPTVDNFGRLGDQPTHPELLDFLAIWLVEHRWSAKEMIRFLVTSRAYQMSSETTERARSLDPDNALLSHMRVRRLEAEAIRDSLLAVSGRLDLTLFGPGANALAAPEEQRRRSVYLTIRRNFLSPFLEVFDAPRPFTTLGKRDATNVPAQSLALLNDPFVIALAGHWAAEVTRVEAPSDARIRRMFVEALARPPSEAELTQCGAYVDGLAREHGPEHRHQAWRDLAQSIFNLKEFVYLR